MAIDSVDARPQIIMKLRNPLIETFNPVRNRVATQMAEFYTTLFLTPSQKTEFTDRDQAIRKTFLSSEAVPQDLRFGVVAIQQLLESVSKSTPPLNQPIDSPPLAEYDNPDVAKFLLHLFSQDPRLADLSQAEKLIEIFKNIALGIFGVQGNINKHPAKGRVKSVEQYFTHGNLSKALELFIIEPTLLPGISKQKPNEK